MAKPAKPLTYNATLLEREDLTSQLSIFKIRPDEPIPANSFVPGQYVTLGMNNERVPDLGSVRRPMSIVSAPEERDVMEFYIRYVSYPESDNPLTHLLWETKAANRLFLRDRAVGKFTIRDTVGDDDPRLRVCVAAGTGLAPFVSMVRSIHLRDPRADLGQYAILHGASYPAELGYREELDSLKASGLHYMTSISRPAESPDWRGDSGRVEDYFMPERLKELDERLGLGAGGLRPDRAAILICGLQGTIGRIIERLIPRGFVPENRKLRRALEVPEDVPSSLFFEQYDNTPVIDVKDPEVIEPLREQLHAALAEA
ncbi:MAG: hypothetical protein GY719_10730 [bacterium]|nr:hypothetical protein [bacterium]